LWARPLDKTHLTMKKKLIFFGALDILVIVFFYQHIISLFTNWTTYYIWTRLEQILIYLSFSISGYFLLRQSKVGLWLTYGQFPLKLISHVYSFSFLQAIIVNYASENYLIWVMTILEIIRLAMTIQIHRKHFSEVRN
jgi:hypothetical protein